MKIQRILALWVSGLPGLAGASAAATTRKDHGGANRYAIRYVRVAAPERLPMAGLAIEKTRGGS